jgi:hypothetical protein
MHDLSLALSSDRVEPSESLRARERRVPRLTNEQLWMGQSYFKSLLTNASGDSPALSANDQTADPSANPREAPTHLGEPA